MDMYIFFVALYCFNEAWVLQCSTLHQLLNEGQPFVAIKLGLDVDTRAYS